MKLIEFNCAFFGLQMKCYRAFNVFSGYLERITRPIYGMIDTISLPQRRLVLVPAQTKTNPPAILTGGFLLVEPPGIEPGSIATLPGLLRAQFTQDLYSALRLGRTRLG